MMRRVILATALAAVLGLAGCSDDAEPKAKDEHPELLQRSDLSDVERASVSDQPSVSKTNCPAMDSEWNLVVSEEFAEAQFTLANDEQVRSAVLGPASGSDGIDETFARLTTMIDECATQGPAFGTFERVEGLPEGQLGFVATQDTSNGTQTTERVYAPVDDERAVVVTVVHTGEGEPSTSATDLVPKALDRARG